MTFKQLEIRFLLPVCSPSNCIQIPYWVQIHWLSHSRRWHHACTVPCMRSMLMPRPGQRMLVVKYNKWSLVLLLVRKTFTLLRQGISGLRPCYVIFPIRCGRKPGDEGLHAGAPGPSPQEQATFLVGRDSVHMSMGTAPCDFPILPVITIRLETARQEGPRMSLLQRSTEHSPCFWPRGLSVDAATSYKSRRL